MTKGGHRTVPVKYRLAERRVKKDTQHTRGTAGFPAPSSHLIHLGCSVPKEFGQSCFIILRLDSK